VVPIHRNAVNTVRYGQNSNHTQQRKPNMITGSKQFLTAKHELLSHFDLAKDKARGHAVMTYHGCFVEEKFRVWLQSFLPKKFGVCAGYVVSQGLTASKKFPHFDVIIYDAINSPTLWVEELSNNTSKSMAIPVEHVFAVLEIKSTLDTSTIEHAINHINDLSDVSAEIDNIDERYKKHLPGNFFWGLVFIDTKASVDKSAKTIFDKLLKLPKVRGYYSSLLIRCEGTQNSGSLKILAGDQYFEMPIGITSSGLYLLNEVIDQCKYIGVSHFWSDIEFVTFAFDVLALLNGTFKPGLISSFHGLDFSIPTEAQAPAA